MNKAIELLSSYRKDIDATQIAEVLWLSQFMNINQSEPITPTDSSEQHYTPAPSNNSEFEFKEMYYSLSINSNKGTSKDSEEDFGFEGNNNASTYSVGFTNSNDFPNILKQFESLRFKEKRLDITLLDEEKTADEIALVGFFHPIFQEVQNRENYFDLNIIIDESKSMFLWQEHIKHFIKEIKLSPVFNNINIVHLNSSENEALFKDEKSNDIKFDAPLFKQDRRLTFIFTDVVGKAWRSNHMFSVIDTWSKYSFVSIVSMLPNHMWQKTPLRQGVNTFMKSTKILPKNRDLKLEYNFIERKLGSVNTKIPVISYDDSSFQNLSNVITAKKDSWIDARIFGELELKALKDKEPLKISAEERVERFFASSLPETRKLAIYCSVLPLHSRIIEKLIEEKSLGQGMNAFVELYFGSLIDRNANTSNNQYEFYKKVRRELISYISVEGIELLFELLNDVITKSLGLKTSIINLLYADSSELSNLGKKEKGIAKFLIEVLKEKGKYFKQQIETLNDMTQKQSIEFSMIQVSEVNLEIGKNLVSVEEYNLFCEDTEKEKVSNDSSDKGSQPIVNISWDDASSYCDWLSKKLSEKYRLPTKKEREYFSKKVDLLEDVSNNISEWCEEKIFWSSSEKKSDIGFRVLKEFKSSLTIEELKKIISQDENEKLEFKAKWNQDIHELVKNIFSLANGSPKHIDETAYFIIGVDERDKNNFSLKRSDVSDIFSELEKLLKEYSEPKVSNVLIEWYDLAEDNGVLVISIPSQGHLISLKEDLITRKGKIEKKETIFYRDRDSTKIASDYIVQKFIEAYGIIILYKEDNLDIDLLSIVEKLNEICTYLTFKIGKEFFKLEDEVVSWSESYKNLNSLIYKEIKWSIGSFFFTKKPYNNNYFFQGNTHYPDLMIVSFSGWNALSTLPYSNAIAYFSAEILSIKLSSYQHQENTGCLYDFSSNKADIDKNMRKAYICESCYKRIEDNKSNKNMKTLKDIENILEIVGKASKNDLDILDKKGKKKEKSFEQLTSKLGKDSLIGREKELNEIDNFLTNTSTLLINGIGGIGKSTIASYYLHSQKEKLDYYGFFEGIDSFINELREPLTLKEEKKEEAFMEALTKLKKLKGNKLLVIDDVKNIEENQDKIEKILALENSGYKILLTSREEIEDITRYELNVLSMDDAKKLFNSIYEVEDEMLLEEILNYLDCHAFFVEMTAKTLKSKKTLTPEIIKEKFENGEFSTIKYKRKESFADYLNNLFSFDELDDEDILILKQFSVLPSIKIEFEFLEEIFDRKDDDNFEEILNYLSEKGWLNSLDNGYKLSQITKEYILTNYLPSFEDIEVILDSLNTSDLEGVIANKEYIVYLESLINFFENLGVKNEKVTKLLEAYPKVITSGSKPYNEMNKESVLEYAKHLEGKTLREVLSQEIIDGMKTDESGNKGHYGQKIEKYYFGYNLNSDASADFPCGLELKASPLKRLQNGSLSPKERLVFNIINYENIIYETWETSTFLEKNSEILLLRYIDPMDKNVSQLDYRIIDVQIHKIFDNLEDKKQFEEDWNVIVNKVKNGQAHNLSESDTKYLGACTKGSTALKSLRSQPNSPELAKQRAFSFKTQYMRELLRRLNI